MHIYEGVLSATAQGQAVLVAGAAASVVGTAIGLYKIDYHKLPQVALLSSAFFVASLVQIPLGPTTIHLLLGGLMGLVLGWAAFPAVLVALLLQAVFFSMGGPTTLGLNTLVMALPAVACYYLFQFAVRSNRQPLVFAAGFAAGATAVVLGALLSAGALLLAGRQFAGPALGVLAAHVPVAILEGLVTGSVIVLLRKVRPEILRSPDWVPPAQEAFDG